MSDARPVFHSTTQGGFSAEVSNHPRRVKARKLAREVGVEFVTQTCIIQTREGTVQARTGDAIITGTAGEHWRVSRGHFPQKYRPVPPTAEGQNGRYVSVANHILAVHMTEDFEVVLSDGVSHLHGSAGDWLVDYGDGSLGVVASKIFDSTYELMG